MNYTSYVWLYGLVMGSITTRAEILWPRSRNQSLWYGHRNEWMWSCLCLNYNNHIHYFLTRDMVEFQIIIFVNNCINPDITFSGSCWNIEGNIVWRYATMALKYTELNFELVGSNPLENWFHDCCRCLDDGMLMS